MNNQAMNKTLAYLDSYYDIRIITSYETRFSSAYLVSKSSNVLLNIVKESILDDKRIVYLKSHEKISSRSDYYVSINNEQVYLNIGDITLTKEFDLENFTNEALGVFYNTDKVLFKLWAPVSKEVKVVIDEIEYEMHNNNTSVYEVEVENYKNALDGAKYYYLVRNNETFVKTLDPYAISVNSDFTYCYIINPKKLYKQKHSFISGFCDVINESIVYELNVRDFTITLPLKHKGEYLGIVESKTLENQGINYLVDLGITHVQLMPTYSFGGVNNNIKDAFDKDFKYNWGYNPVLYNAPCNWYASCDNAYNSINEFKMMIDEFHKNKIGVILDVVYNHVYNMEEYALNVVVPKYPYRYFESGDISNGSWCGNDVATERLMNRKFIIDSLKYYQSEFNIDGFRFDLMGLIDTKTMNLAKEELTKTNPNTLLYGEGWQMWTAYNPELLSHMFNSKEVPNIGFFNDFFRNTLKGKYAHSKPGILVRGEQSKEVIDSLLNTRLNKDQSYFVNYVECHDNMTFYDEQKSFGINEQDIKENAKIALIFVLFSKGLAFIHSGQEILRTKLKIDNTYNLSDIYNKFPWHLTFINEDLLKYYKELIALRKDIEFFKYKHFKTVLKDKIIKVIYKYENEYINIYFNLRNTTCILNLEEKEEVLFSSNKNTSILRKSIVITKTKDA